MPNKEQIINILFSWICILLIIISGLVYSQAYLINDMKSLKPEIEALNSSIMKIMPLVISINQQCKDINDHVDNKRNVICETYKRDLKVVRYNGKNHTLISFDYTKGNKIMNQLLKQDDTLKGVYFDYMTGNEIPYSDPGEAMRAFEEAMKEYD